MRGMSFKNSFEKRRSSTGSERRRSSTGSFKLSINGKKQSTDSQELSHRPSYHNHQSVDLTSIEKEKKSTESNDSFPSEEKDTVPDVIKRIESTVSVSSEEIYDSCFSDIEV